ncbi:unknown [Cercopithecine alphaherpesvirus 9]|uniref:Tegument protein UL51 n=1 Tax=Cercopithecine herpesvirus 9 (strain DHV) TaxID=36348 RepID=Q9E209_CHV9D|nr:tegument protein UL51 [Cercopithecine alphaherpesvirus 9]AAG27244.1 unknown [Cercopithecine alphaherpesvirus 9]
MHRICAGLCGYTRVPLEDTSYEEVRGKPGPSGPALLRLQEALAMVNMLLPAPVTIEDVVTSADNTRRLVRAQALARTYAACSRNLECLRQHKFSEENPSLNSVIKSHIQDSQRLADTCLAAITNLYLSVGSVDTTTDALVDQTIRMVAENEVVMSDVILMEKTLGVDNQCGVNAMLTPAPPGNIAPCSEDTERHNITKPFTGKASRNKRVSEESSQYHSNVPSRKPEMEHV